jgi:DNA-binding ferritin-like protein
MNNIQILQTTTNCQTDILDSVRSLSVNLLKAKISIQMLHLYSNDYQVHLIFGNLYEKLDELFDTLLEEIIGTSKLQNVQFPSFSDNIDLSNIQQFKGGVSDITNTYHRINSEVLNILTSLEFNNYINNVRSGINNTKEEIISAFNKTNYLLSLVNVC